MATNSKLSSPPPVSSLNSTTKPPPMMVVPDEEGSPPNRRLAFMWPTREDWSAQNHDAIRYRQSDLPIATHSDIQMDVVVAPSGHTILRTKSCYHAVYPPGIGPRSQSVPSSHSESIFGISPQPALGKLFSTRYKQSQPYEYDSDTGRNATRAPRPLTRLPLTRLPLTRALTWHPSTSTPISSQWKNKSTFFHEREEQYSPVGISLSSKPQSLFQAKYKDSKRQFSEDALPASENEIRWRGRDDLPVNSFILNSDEHNAQNFGRNIDKLNSISSASKRIQSRKDLLHSYNAKKDIGNSSKICWILKWSCFLLLIFAILVYLYIQAGMLLPPERPIVKDFNELLKQNVFGQHIVLKQLPKLLSGFLTAGAQSSQVMVLSFHGGSGVGKTFVVQLMANHLIDSSQQLDCFHTLVPSVNIFHTVTPQEVLWTWLHRASVDCPISMHVIDDISGDTPPDFIAALSNVLTHLRESSSSTKQIVIILSDIGATRVNKEAFKSNTLGKSVQFNELDKVIQDSFKVIDKFNFDEHLEHKRDEPLKMKTTFTDLSKVIDCFLPFCPLNRSHVEKCIVKDASAKGIQISDMDLTWVADQVSYVPLDWPMFSASGCKHVSEKVDLLHARKLERSRLW